MSVKEAIKSQYRASLDMLSQAVSKCPDGLWDDRTYQNAFWHIVYHALFYTHLYLQPSEKDLVPWSKGRGGYRRLADKPAGEPYRREEILEYLDFCREQVEKQVAALDLEAPSGFSWLPYNKLEVQIYNIRHLQQHIGELCERLGAKGDITVDWVL